MTRAGYSTNGIFLYWSHQLSLPHRGNAPATFLPLEAEDNLRMLMNLGLIGSNAGVWNTSGKLIKNDGIRRVTRAA